MRNAHTNSNSPVQSAAVFWTQHAIIERADDDERQNRWLCRTNELTIQSRWMGWHACGTDGCPRVGHRTKTRLVNLPTRSFTKVNGKHQRGASRGCGGDTRALAINHSKGHTAFVRRSSSVRCVFSLSTVGFGPPPRAVMGTNSNVGRTERCSRSA